MRGPKNSWMCRGRILTSERLNRGGLGTERVLSCHLERINRPRRRLSSIWVGCIDSWPVWINCRSVLFLYYIFSVVFLDISFNILLAARGPKVSCNGAECHTISCFAYLSTCLNTGSLCYRDSHKLRLGVCAVYNFVWSSAVCPHYLPVQMLQHRDMN